eukprot:TRINITY_DN65159_c0_g1_i1.p1 TRINITY_DN65159_c0_g1~~TRINITY_DN65159_c0_g1_i1.p1  ORF type:complete len:207 (+),score=17.11 TRINITY_DN65159_c0_g1_i1:108-728(+)
MPDEKGARTVGVSDLPRTIKGYQWFEALSSSRIKIEGVSLLGNNKGATRYAAVVVLETRDQAKEFARRVKDKQEGPRSKVLNSDADVEHFRAEMVKNKGWSSDAPDGDRAITPHSGADIRGDATGFKHGFNPRRVRSPSRRRRTPSPSRSARRSRSRSRSRSPRRRSPSQSRRRRGGSPSPPRRGRGGSRGRSPSRGRRRSRSSRS